MNKTNRPLILLGLVILLPHLLQAAQHPVAHYDIATGVWYCPAASDHNTTADKEFNFIHSHENMGVYAVAEKGLFHEARHHDQGLWTSVRFDLANERLNRFDHYIGAGLEYRGFLPGHDNDALGFAIARAHNGNYFTRWQHRSGHLADQAETALELTWRIQLSSELSLTPDLQFIIHPGTDPAVADALVAGIRFSLGL